MTTVCLLVPIANGLSSGIAGTSANTVCKDCLANEGWQTLLVVLETWCGIIRGADTAIGQCVRNAAIVCRFTTAKSSTGADFGLAPLGSLSERDSGWIDGRVGGLRSSEAGKQRDNDGRLDEHSAGG